MKRLIPAVIILIFLISICIFSNIYVDRTCKQTVEDINAYYDQNISADTLHDSWKIQKEKMSLFVNHDFLDKISVYIGQLTIGKNGNNPPESDDIYKNIQTLLSLIKEEQKFALHSFY